MTTDDTISTSKGLCPACGFEATDGSTVCPRDGVVLIPQLVEDPFVGKTLDGRYAIESVIGFGGITVVYKALDTRLNRSVVIKMLHSELVEDHRKLERFQRGARAASVLNHPNIVAVHDCVLTDKGVCYLVMDYAEGTTLSDLVGYHGAIAVERGIRIFSQVCSALACAHDKKIVHRNIKPSNILITRAEDGSDLVKLGDFGIAKQLVGEGEVVQKVTRTGQWVGSPLYMSPEQAQSKPVDARSDIFSLGKVMLEAFKGKLPILADSMVEPPDSMRAPDRPHPEYVDPIPAPLRQIIARCLQKDPKARYQSVRELTRDLDALLGGKGKTGLSFGMQLSRVKNRLGPVPTGLILLVILLVVLGGAYALYSNTLSGQIELTKLSLTLSELSATPNDARLLGKSYALGDLYMKAGRYKEAEANYEAAARAGMAIKERDPLAAVRLYFNLFKAATAAGDKTTAKNAALKAGKIIEDKREGRFDRIKTVNLVDLLPMLELKEQMVRSIFGANGREYASAQVELGDSCLAARNINRAQRYFQEAIRITNANPPSDAETAYWGHQGLAAAYMLDGQFAKSENEFLNAAKFALIAFGPCGNYTIKASIELGNLYFLEGKYDQAIDRYKAALTTEAGNGSAQTDVYRSLILKLADAYRAQKDTAAAEALLKRSLASACNDVPGFKLVIMRRLAACYADQGMHSKADNLMRQANSLQNSMPSSGATATNRLTGASSRQYDRHR